MAAKGGGGACCCGGGSIDFVVVVGRDLKPVGDDAFPVVVVGTVAAMARDDEPAVVGVVGTKGVFGEVVPIDGTDQATAEVTWCR